MSAIEGSSNLLSGKGDDGPPLEKDEDGPLSGKPYFNIMLTKSALKPRNLLVIPKAGSNLLLEATVETTLIRGDRIWNVTYYGSGTQKRFDILGWGKFAKDNDLEDGDCCIFEVMEVEGTKMTLRVLILSGQFPPELEREMEHEMKRAMEGSEDAPVVIE